MGVALAHEAVSRGALVTLICGPGTPKVDHPNVKQVYVQTAHDMYEATAPLFDAADVAILAAAVADYTPANVVDQKIKKKESALPIELSPTVDILKSLGEVKKSQKLIGFALETTNELENAQGKLKRKNLDMIVLNSLNDKGAGFGHDTNKITVIHANNSMVSFDLKTKLEVAVDIVNEIEKL
jgi:phosphopantothenoylcysteine decarboxylase/phosphopantothenate--cysteine ligase